MLPGEYEFNTGDKEIVEIFSGEPDVLLPGTDQWKAIKGGEVFEVPSHSTFGLRIKSLKDYCCSYVQ